MQQYKGHRVIEYPGASEPAAGIAAKFPGVCAQCRGPIIVGQLIDKNQAGGWSHVECPIVVVDPLRMPADPAKLVGKAATLTSEAPAGLPNGVWTIEGPRGHRTFRISTILSPKAPQAPEYSPASQGDKTFREKHAGKRVLELLTGPDNTGSYRGLAWYDGSVGKLWRFGEQNEVLVRTFAKLVEREETIAGYAVHFARNCYKCNRLLTTPESIQRGIGPICAAGGWDA